MSGAKKPRPKEETPKLTTAELAKEIADALGVPEDVCLEALEEPERAARVARAIHPMPEGIAAKLAHVRAQVESVAKDAYNPQSGGYHYASWGNVLSAVRGHLDDVGLHLHLSVAGARDLGNGVLLVEIDYAWIDTETAERFEGRWFGTGQDRGDKALYKAYSGALKYLVLDTFMIPTDDDPENPGAGSGARQQGQQQPRQAEPPRIPRDRAERIVAAARDAGMEQVVFEAKLHDLGFSRVVDLSVDAAESMEAFVRAEADSKAAA